MDSVYYGLCGCVDFAIFVCSDYLLHTANFVVGCLVALVYGWLHVAWLVKFVVRVCLVCWWFWVNVWRCLFGLRGLSGGRYCWLGWFEMGLLLRFGCFLVCILLLLFVML